MRSSSRHPASRLPRQYGLECGIFLVSEFQQEALLGNRDVESAAGAGLSRLRLHLRARALERRRGDQRFECIEGVLPLNAEEVVADRAILIAYDKVVGVSATRSEPIK